MGEKIKEISQEGNSDKWQCSKGEEQYYNDPLSRWEDVWGRKNKGKESEMCRD